MTDLENLWDAYPTGPAPVGAILTAADSTGRGRRRRVLVRPLLTAAAVTALAGAYLAGALTGGPGGSGPGGSGPGGPSAGAGGVDRLPRHVAFQADLEPATSCDDLRASYVRRGLELVGPWGWSGGGPIAYGMEGDLLRRSISTPDSDQAVGAARTPRTERQTNSETGTNVQEAGVDEPDTVKTDGSVLVAVRHDRLDVYDVTGSSTAKVSTVDLPGVEGPEILLAGDTVVALGRDAGTPAEAPGTRVLTVSIADPAAPKVVDDVRYDAREVSARQHEDTVRLVLANGLPELDFVEPTGKRSEQEALAHNRKAVTDSTLADWLPTVAVGDAKPTQLLDCRDVALPSDALALGTTGVVGFDATDAGRLDAIGLAGLADIAYESADHLYLASAGSDSWGCIDWCGDVVTGTSRAFPGGLNDGTSYVFGFALDGTRATHVASGEVEGAIRDRWSLDEAGGVLRVAVGPTSETGNFSSVVTFEQQGRELVERGRLDGLGRNEEIESVRWFDDLAIVVTFRRRDPLYTVDLSDTSAPRLLGALKIPGFSAYLHPLGRARLIGVGAGPGPDGWGAQVGLFDVRDTDRVSRLDVLGYGRATSALAGTDPRAFTWLPDRRTVLTVVERWGSRRVGYLSVLKLAGGRLQERRIKVEYGADVDLVRAVPLPDGRVVLVTGEEAQFLEL
ncbi:beta-propeller domain-containing protein [Nocardioides daeguensis]|uniref:Beta propeller domain-containing protein n=1 Tax=Nocardioides daeguensis TaxID=908359 RepID=A0ABP6UZZ1_9ACTN|nr:beta-propeller domain-containing protein [Nocardioides daeguensis]MBV6727140.1 beta-propeller domain-containing protein [Nocardioides daeguensis]MCR1771154.1 beta-propeller domain-containing protein [Nocardioides daeguensis]